MLKAYGILTNIQHSINLKRYVIYEILSCLEFRHKLLPNPVDPDTIGSRTVSVIKNTVIVWCLHKPGFDCTPELGVISQNPWNNIKHL